MFLDAQAVFSPFASMGGTPQSLAISTSTASTNTYDVTGAGYGNTPSLSFGSTVFGADMGIGAGMFQPAVLIVITTTLATSSSATLNIALQSGQDNGSNAVSTWTTIAETGAIAAANLTSGTTLSLLFNKRAPGSPLPRFYRLYYQIPSATSFTAGAASAGIVVNYDTSTTIGQTASNFTAV